MKKPPTCEGGGLLYGATPVDQGSGYAVTGWVSRNAFSSFSTPYT